MAWLAAWGNTVRECKTCESLTDPKKFPKGVRVKINSAFDCLNCRLWKCQPISENLIITKLYSLLPGSYDFHGNKQFTISDIISLFKIKEIQSDLYDDYLERIMFLHNEIIDERQKRSELESKKQKSSNTNNQQQKEK